jgi:hypothetical protein
MKPVKLLGVGALALGASLLSGCEVQKQFGASCTTSPPVPHQNEGIVDVDVEVPPNVKPGDTFTVRIDNMVGYPALAGPGQFPSGVISVTGPVTPSGNIGVGPGFFGAPYPDTIELTVTGQPGEEIVLGAVWGSSFFGTFPTNGFQATCSTIGGGEGAEITRIPIVAPES